MRYYKDYTGGECMNQSIITYLIKNVPQTSESFSFSRKIFWGWGG